MSSIFSPFTVRRVNDQLMQLERAFIDPNGLPGRSLKRFASKLLVLITNESLITSSLN